MDRSLDELEAIVRNRICSVCTERTTGGECGLEDASSCALFRLFPQVAQAIQSVDSNDIHQYIDAIRSNVCSGPGAKPCHQRYKLASPVFQEVGRIESHGRPQLDFGGRVAEAGGHDAGNLAIDAVERDHAA